MTDYLLKPFGFERFFVAIEKVTRQSATESIHPDFIFIKTGYSTERVDLADILYVEGMNEYLQIVTPKRKLMTLLSFQQFATNLPARNFVRVHKSYLVTLDKIERIERHIIIIGDKRIPIGQTYKEMFYRRLS